MRIGLRWKILLLTVLAPVALAVGTLWTVNGTVSSHQQDNIHENLRRSSRVFENMMSARANALEVAAAVIVRDPRFFSILTLPAAPNDPEFRATVRGVAMDFHAITRSDLFEVLDRGGRVIASAGPDASTPVSRDALVRRALNGEPASGILAGQLENYQVTVVPVLAGGRVVGALLIGAELGRDLALQLRALTHSEVTFVSGRSITGTTLAFEDRSALVLAARRVQDGPGRLETDVVFEVRGGSATYLTLLRRIPGAVPGERQLYAMQRSQDVETAFLTGMQVAMMRLGVIAILVALVMGVFVSERITRPVKRLVRGAEEMERGNYDYPLQIRSRDEIGYLADRFLEMRQREKDYIGGLEEVARIKSEFIAIASHELRTPISVIKGFVELFFMGTLGQISSDQRSALAAIERSVQHLTRIAEDATRMAQIRGDRLALALGEHAIEDLAREAVSVAAAEAPGRDLAISSVVEPGLPPARVDGPRLTQAVTNLVRNGIRFTPDGGTVEVRAWRDGEWLAIEVRDTGVGIPREHVKHVFDRSIAGRDALHHHSSSALEFNSAGLGLGLGMVRGIAEAHGGTAEAASREGEGSRFTIRVPYRGEDRLDEAA